jgi:hypothetical protein
LYLHLCNSQELEAAKGAEATVKHMQEQLKARDTELIEKASDLSKIEIYLKRTVNYAKAEKARGEAAVRERDSKIEQLQHKHTTEAAA